MLAAMGASFEVGIHLASDVGVQLTGHVGRQERLHGGARQVAYLPRHDWIGGELLNREGGDHEQRHDAPRRSHQPRAAATALASLPEPMNRADQTARWTGLPAVWLGSPAVLMGSPLVVIGSPLVVIGSPLVVIGRWCRHERAAPQGAM